MRRKLTLFAAALGVILGGMGLYLIFSSGYRPPDIPITGALTTRPEEQPTTEVFQTRLGTGKKLAVPLFQEVEQKDPFGNVTTRVRQVGRLKAEESRVLAPGRFRLLQPRFWHYLKDGRVILLRADTGDFLATEAAAQSLNPKRGTLSGNVFLLIDRNNHPDRPPPETRPWDTVRIRMDQVEFDYADNLIRTESVLRLESYEADIDARGLVLRWDAVTRQITDLKLNTEGHAIQGRAPFPGRMVIRRGLEIAKVGPPRIGVGPNPPAPPEGRGQPTTRPESPPDPAKVQTYVATFHRDVEILEGADPAAPTAFRSKLFSDQTVSVIFDFSPPKGETAFRTAGPGRGAGTPAQPRRAGAGEPPVPPAQPPDQNILVTWKGVLTMVPWDRTRDEDRLVTGLRRELIAEGDNVVLLQEDGKTATCLKLNYDTETRIARLFGSKQRMVTLLEPDGRRIECESLIFEQDSDRIVIIGSGTMLARNEAPSARKPPGAQRAVLSADDPEVIMVQWDRQVEATLAGPQGRSADTPTTQPGPPGGDYIREAVFRGNVRIRQSTDFHIAADEISVLFTQPSPTMRANQLEFVQAVGQRDADGRFIGQVRILREQNDVYCDRLTLQMKPTGEGATVPEKALAIGHVKAAYEGNLIGAERMELPFGPRPAGEGQPTDRAEFVPQEVQAYKNVTITNAERGLKASGDHLYSLIGSKKATLTGQSAKVQLGQRRLTGTIIEIDQGREAVQVLGAGSLAFDSDRDLTGQAAPEPVTVRAVWAQSMNYDGTRDLAELRGDVRATTGRSYVQADLLLLYLEDRPAPPAPVAPAVTERPGLGSPIPMRRDGGGLAGGGPPTTQPRAEPGSPIAMKGDWGPSTTRPADRATTQPTTQPADPLAEGLAAKRLKRVVAERGVIALTSRTDPKTGFLLTRARIECQQLLFDNADGQLDANGPGSLLLEDYRRQDPKTRPAGDDTTRPASLRPSQTAFAWERQMRFNTASLLGTFDGDVRMGHRGPSSLTVDRTDGSVKASPDGGVVTLNCRNLLVQFLARERTGSADDGGPRRAGDADPAGGPSPAEAGFSRAGGIDAIRDVQAVRATGGVYLEDGENWMSVTGEMLEYLKSTDTVTIEGGQDERGKDKDARIDHIAPDGSRYDAVLAPRINWNRTTGRVEAFKVRGTGSSPRRSPDR